MGKKLGFGVLVLFGVTAVLFSLVTSAMFQAQTVMTENLREMKDTTKLPNTWTPKILHPSERYGHAMAYAPDFDFILMFGGYNSSGYLGDTWIFYPSNGTWHQQTALTSPQARSYGGLAYDILAKKFVLFGGYNGSAYLDDTWCFDPTTKNWTLLWPSTKPSPRAYFGMTHVLNLGVVVHGGYDGSNQLADLWVYNSSTNVWTPKYTPPSPRYGYACVAIPVRNAMFLFGGYSSNYAGDTWLYFFTNNTWVNLTNPTSPSPRVYPALTYDAVNDVVILFGGYDGTNYLADTWVYDFAQSKWINKMPGSSPEGRSQAGCAFIEESGVLLLYGGYNGLYLADTWIYNYSANTWTAKLVPPAARYGYMMAYSPHQNLFVVFGGYATNYRADTWHYYPANNTWANVSPTVSPSARYYAGFTYDENAQKFILFGGYDGTNYLNDIWVYDAVTRTWTQRFPSPTPPARYRCELVYDNINKVNVLFGGYTAKSPTYLNDVWLYNYSANTWTPRYAPPTARYGYSIVYHESAQKFVLFGGYDGIAKGDTWIYDPSTGTWANVTPATSPPSRYYGAMAYDDSTQQILLFGGYTGSAYLSDTWVYNLTTNAWTQKLPGIAPPGRESSTLVYNSSANCFILFGGYNGTYFNDTWAYTVSTNTWTNQSPTTSPPARNAHGMVYDPVSTTTIIFGGYSGSYLNDLWTYDLVANTWVQKTQSTKPSIRGRMGFTFDTTTGLAVLFGGYDGSTRLSDTWLYSVSSNSWTNANPSTPVPSGRSSISIAGNGKIYLFSGYPGYSPYLNDFWHYEILTNKWTPVVPVGRSGAGLVSLRNGDLLLFGGYCYHGSGYLSDTWKYNVTSNEWNKLASSTTPSARERMGMSYIQSHGKVLLFGGYSGTGLGDTWVFDTGASTWSQLSPISSPLSRYGHRIVYASENDKIMLFSGYSYAAGVPIPDMFWYNYTINSWEEVMPSGRSGTKLVYHEAAKKPILFGGLGIDTYKADTWSYNITANAWVNKLPSGSPSGRRSHGMTYDATTQLIVLFGGYTGSASDLTYIYDYSSNTWTQQSPSTKPGVRYSIELVYDNHTNTVRLFGGYTGSYNLNDFWSYSVTSVSWSETVPSKRYSHGIAHAENVNLLVLYGGYDAVRGSFTDTWTYTFLTNSWTKVQTANNPGVRRYFSSVYDSANAMVVLFGGYEGTYGKNDTWLFNPVTNVWAQQTMTYTPPGRYGYGVNFDTNRNRIWVFGGYTGSYYLSDTVYLASTSNLWMPLYPEPRYGHGIVYHEAKDLFVLFGGFLQSGVRSSETWVYNHSSNRWTLMFSDPAPSARTYMGLVYDPDTELIVLFGGYGATTGLNDTWVYDITTNTWTSRVNSGAPSPRNGHGMVYDTVNKKVLVFGGYNTSGSTYNNETWVYDVNTNVWTKQNPAVAPLARAYFASAYGNGQFFIFGGESNSGYLNDTWAYSLSTNTWSNQTTLSAPARRGNARMCFDSENNVLILFGGYGNTGYFGDTWRYNFTANQWVNLNPSISPLSRTGLALAYDTNTSTVILFGGYGYSRYLADVWEYNYNTSDPITIYHTPFTSAQINQPINLSAHVVSKRNITDVKLYYKPTNEDVWYAIAMTRVSGNATDGYYNGTIPGQTSTGTLLYYITATDESTYSQSTSTYNVVIQPVGEIATMLWFPAVCLSIFFSIKIRKRKT
ncbi:MAG: kelch repeat-containing protein [Thermoplasmata archaeon]